MKRRLIGATLLVALSTPVAAQPPGLVVSVASSLHDALAEIAGLYRAATGVTVALNPAGSNTLARQIVEGAKVGLFLSADDIQMDVVEKAGRLVPGTRTRLLTNSLAVIIPAGSRRALTAAGLADPAIRRIAMGEPFSVPAGVYGRKWLERERLWTAVAPKVVPFPTVRGVVAAVEAGRADAGIVYLTDTVDRPALSVPLLVPPSGNPDLAIVHSAAVVRGPGEADARKFLQFLQSPPAREVFVRRRFGRP
jgi:molybdate transport system substrate-binding protein